MTNAELKSALMDTEQATQVADAEHTEAADVANLETQSIYAWSQDDDADTELAITHRRSWRLPIAIAALAVAAAGTVAAIHFWPHEQKFAGQKTPLPAQTSLPVVQPTVAPAPSQQTSPPAQPMSPDQRFISVFKDRGGLVEPGREQMVISEGREVCTRLTSENENQLIADMLQGTPGMTRFTAELFADSAIDVYCPQYAPHQ